MANQSHLELLGQGAEKWNQWRRDHAGIRPDLSEARLVNSDLSRSNLDGADLSHCDLSKAELSHATFNRANLESATLILADLLGASLNGANLKGVSLFGAFLFGTRLKSTRLEGANLLGATLMGADLSGADLTGAHLMGANFHEANLTGANLTRANLTAASLIGTRVDQAVFESCHVHGIAAWNLEGEPSSERDLIVSPLGESEIAVSQLEFAQFCNLLLAGDCASRLLQDSPPRVALFLTRKRRPGSGVENLLQRVMSDRSFLLISIELPRPLWGVASRRVKAFALQSRMIFVDLDSGQGMSELILQISEALPMCVIQPIGDARQELPSAGNILTVNAFSGEKSFEQKLLDKILPRVEKRWDQLRRE